MKEIKKKGGRINNYEINELENNNNPIAISVPKILEAQKKYTAQEKKLKGMKWGMGLEHETQFFYKIVGAPTYKLKTYKLKDTVIFDSLTPLTELLNEYKLTEADRNLLLKIDYEKTGRKCQGITVLEKTPISMPEFITEEPFSTTDNPKTIRNYFNQLLEKESRFFELMLMNVKVDDFLKKNDLSIGQYPFGMCSNIKVRKNYDSTSTTLDKKSYVDYTGSFHFTVTLPFLEKDKYSEEDEKKFRDIHYNFGAMLQWIEPLLMAGYFSCDQNAVGTLDKRIRGSFRVGRVGWGNFAGSDMRKKDTGVGRYADVYPYWRKGFDFYQSNVTIPCFEPNPKLKEKQAVSSFSSNIRTFGPNPENPRDRISGAPMKIPNGVEIRIFDHFQTENLLSLLQIIILIAANSINNKVEKFVYEDKDWQETTRKIMLEGWRSEIDMNYLKKVLEIYQITINPKSYQAWDILDAIVEALYKKNIDSDLVFLMYGHKDAPFIPKINKYSWDLAFLLKLIEEDEIYKKYLNFLSFIIKNETLEEFKEGVLNIFGNEWKNNWKDILYFLEGKDIISRNDNKYKCNLENLKSLYSRKQIGLEISLYLNYNRMKFPIILEDKTNKFFYKKNIEKRFKDLYNYESSIYQKKINLYK